MKRIVLFLLFLTMLGMSNQVSADSLQVTNFFYESTNEKELPNGNIDKNITISLSERGVSEWQIKNICLTDYYRSNMIITAELENDLIRVVLNSERDLNEEFSTYLKDISFCIHNIEAGKYNVEITTELEGKEMFVYVVEDVELAANNVFYAELESGNRNEIPENYEYVPIIREDVVLEYIDTETQEISYITFSGIETINEKQYHKCYFCDKSGNVNDEKVFAYLREEDKRVYVYPDKEQWEFSMGYWLEGGFFEPYTDEILIYDFDMKEGDAIRGYAYNLETVIINDVDYILIGEKYRKRYKFRGGVYSSGNGACIIEGIGIIGIYSYMPYPLPDTVIDFQPVNRVLFTKEYSKDGQLIYQSTYPNYDPGYGNIYQIDRNETEIFCSQGYNQIRIVSNGNLTVGVYTLDGVKMLDGEGDGEVVLSTAELPIGIYIVKAMTETAEKTMKIVVK